MSYKELKSGAVTLDGKKIRVSSLSSLKTARKVAGTLKSWIENGEFFLTAPVERLPLDTVFKPMRQTEETPFVANVMQKAVTCKESEAVQAIAERIVTRSVNHIVMVDGQGKLNWDRDFVGYYACVGSGQDGARGHCHSARDNGEA